MNIRKTGETAAAVTLGWDPVAGAAGFRFNVDGKVSHTFDGARTSVRVAKGSSRVSVEALGVKDTGVWPAPASSWPPVDLAPQRIQPARTLDVISAGELAQALAGIRPGDLVRARNFTHTGQLNLGQQLAGKAELDLGDVRLVGNTYNGNAALFQPRNLHVFGGVLSAPNGSGLLTYSGADAGWWDFLVDGVGGSAFRAFAVTGKLERCTFVGRVTNNGLDLSLDPHADKGTGLHASYIGGQSGQHGVFDSRFAIDAHDINTGSNQIGAFAQRCKFWYRARNFKRDEQQQTAGNAVQLFGEKLADLDIWVEADTVTHVVDARWIQAGSRDIRVNHGRGVNVRRTPKYTPHQAVTYTDCT